MREKYSSDINGPEDQRLSSLRSSLISPGPAYLAQQQWHQGDHASSWNTTDTNQYPHYQHQQQWMVGQYAPAGEESFVPQHGYWGGYELQGQQMLGSSEHGTMIMDQANADLSSKNNKVGNDGNIRKEFHGHEASNNHTSSKHHPAKQDVHKNKNVMGETPPVPTEQELQMKRAAAIASLQKRTASAGPSGNESTSSRGASGTPPHNKTQVVSKSKERNSSETRRTLFQTGDKTKREPASADSSSPIEKIAEHSKQSFADGDAMDTPSNQSSRNQEKDDGEGKRGMMHGKASSIDIDGLLAEGRAAAEASQKTETNGDGGEITSSQPSAYHKGGLEKEPDTKVDSSQHNSRPRAVSSDPSELGEIRDEPVQQHRTPQSSSKGTISASKESRELDTPKSQSSRPNGLSKNPTTKTDTPIDKKEPKQTTNQLGDPEKRRSGIDSRTQRNLDSTPRSSRRDSLQSSQPRGEMHSESKSELRSVERGNKSQGFHSRPDRPIYEPSRHPPRYKVPDQLAKEPKENESDRVATTGHPHSKTADARIPGDSQKTSTENSSSSSAQIDPLDVEELKEWLVITGYHDEAFRRKTMQRHRRLAALEEERAQLLKEEQEERGALTTARTQSLVSLDEPSVTGTAMPFPGSMPPPKSVNKNDNMSKSFSSLDDRIGTSNKVADGSPSKDDLRASRRSPLKRRLSVSAGHDGDNKPVEKIPRTGHVTDTPDGQNSSQDKHREPPGSRPARESKDGQEDDSVKLTKDKMDRMNEDRREALVRRRSPGSISPNRHEKENDRQNRYSYESNKLRRGWSESSEHREYGPFPLRGRGRGRFHRGSHRGSTFFKPHRSDRKGDGNDLDLHKGGVQYFMVKSWTYDNVEVSQHEGTWATQSKNEEKLSKAFEECRHVILVFSVNTSKAFQGYARMESLPGAPGVRAPSWAEDLVWEPSPPFRIRWITINETRFRYVGHLKNSYNEDEPVLVGRDGQEIEPQCGQSLCELLDNENPNTQGNRPWVKPHRPTSYKTW